MCYLCVFQAFHESYQTSINSRNSSLVMKKTCTNISKCSVGKCKSKSLDLRLPVLEYLQW